MEHDATLITKAIIEALEKNGLLGSLARCVKLVKNFNVRSVRDVAKFLKEKRKFGSHSFPGCTDQAFFASWFCKSSASVQPGSNLGRAKKRKKNRSRSADMLLLDEDLSRNIGSWQAD